MKQDKVVKIADHEATRQNRRKRDSRAILEDCQKLATEHLVRAFPAMLDKVDDALFDRVNQSENAADHSVYFDTMREMRLKRPAINAEFKKRFGALSKEVIQRTRKAPTKGGGKDNVLFHGPNIGAHPAPCKGQMSMSSVTGK